MPRSRGAVTGLLLVILGAWGALIPFVGPNFDFAYTPGQSWTAARGWLEVLPGVATVVGGLLLIASRNRAGAMLGGWLAALGGAWFVVGTTVAPLLGLGSVGDPVAATDRKRAVLELAYFTGLGTLIAFLAGAALARTAARLARDVEPVVQPVETSTTEHIETAPTTQQPYAHQPYASTASTPAESEMQTTPRGQRVATDAAPEADEVHPKGGGFFRRHRPASHVGHAP
ncbi:hypothetical protein MBOU_20600 [Mycobacterium bourgelatii]|uniref:Secreted protein n=2 Tax=Mycobacterium bourgelatii TaxID=1273442 RepID=A0A7I9YN23_MYCBU|nr:hypothetical protein MBOU_20600 [Mycobacterium bourgelatii]